MKYDEQMDGECVRLCDAINSVCGLETYESCCGHGKHDMWIWLTAKCTRDLYLLSRCIDRRYGKFGHWTLEVGSSDDIGGNHVSFWLRSNVMGEQAYREADELSVEIKVLMKIFMGGHSNEHICI